MEIILAICVTGLGIFGGMLVIWNGQNSVSSKTLGASPTRERDGQNNADLCVPGSCS